MNKSSSIFLFSFLFCIFAVSISAQTSQPSPPPPVEDDDVVKISTNLVQFDAIVTDKDGNPITDLKASDFEIYQDGKQQNITDFSFVDLEIPEKSRKEKFNQKLPIPPSQNRPNPTGRLLTFVVDDGNCTSTFIGLGNVRSALNKFVTEQMQPNDSVAIYRTRSGNSLLQQYTNDKNQLLRIIKSIKYLPGRCGTGSGDIITPESENFDTPAPRGSTKFETEEDRENREDISDREDQRQFVGTLGVIRYIVNGLQEMGGRKIIFLFSDGISIRTRNNKISQAQLALRDLTDNANRAGVVINAIASRGITNPSRFGNASQSTPLSDAQIEQLQNLEEGLDYLSRETGGRYLRGNNDLDKLVRKTLNYEKGYYLLAYEPNSDTFKGRNFHKIEIKVNNPNLKVYSRTGFIGTTDRENIANKSRDRELYNAIKSPLLKPGLNLRLTAFFGKTESDTNYVRSLVHIDGKDITFVNNGKDRKKAVIDVVAVTLNENNEVVDEFNRSHTIIIEKDAVNFIKEKGLTYTTDVEVKKAGIYNFRIAIRDANSKSLGSATQIIDIPKLIKNKIVISGLSISSTDKDWKFMTPVAVAPEQALAFTPSEAVPAIRTFQRGMVLAYSYNLYNAKVDKSTGQPKLLVQVNLYKDGQITSKGTPKPAEFEKQKDWSSINDYGYLKLNEKVEVGNYALQIIVKDLLTNRTTTQFIDFEVSN